MVGLGRKILRRLKSASINVIGHGNYIVYPLEPQLHPKLEYLSNMILEPYSNLIQQKYCLPVRVFSNSNKNNYLFQSLSLFLHYREKNLIISAGKTYI